MGEILKPGDHIRHKGFEKEYTSKPCAICNEPGNRNLYQCKKCGRWVCEWRCLRGEICRDCKKER